MRPSPIARWVSAGSSTPTPPGDQPKPLPAGTDILGTANQTRLSGAPVIGPLFDFAPAVDQFLKTPLFGDFFTRQGSGKVTMPEPWVGGPEGDFPLTAARVNLPQ